MKFSNAPVLAFLLDSQCNWLGLHLVFCLHSILSETPSFFSILAPFLPPYNYITHQLKRELLILRCKKWGFYELVFQFCESLHSLFIEYKFHPLLQKNAHSSSNLGKIFDKSPVEPRMTKKTPHPFYIIGRGKLFNNFPYSTIDFHPSL